MNWVRLIFEPPGPMDFLSRRRSHTPAGRKASEPMATLTWNESFATGIAELDTEHKTMVAIFNDLHDSVESVNSRQRISRCLDRLTAQAIEHFAREERLFMATAYPRAVHHKKEHDEMKLWAAGFQKRLDEGMAEGMLLTALDSLKECIYEHMRTADAEFVPYLIAELAA